MKQKPTESYREFAYRWRKEAARVRPPMTEKEIIEVFVRVQEPEYYDRIILLIGAKFAEIVKVGETIEDGLKSGKIARVSASPGSSGLVRKKREEVNAISHGGRKAPRNLPVPKAALTLHQSLIKPTVQTQIIPATTMPAPLIQKPILCRIRIHPDFPKFSKLPPSLSSPSPLPECRSQLR